MIALVQTLQILCGALWLLPALYLTPRIVAAWRPGASRTQVLSAPIGFLAWLMVGFSVRWFLWSHSVAGMGGYELLTWGALYALSGLCAVWFFACARRTRGE